MVSADPQCHHYGVIPWQQYDLDLFNYQTIQLLYLLYCHYSMIEIFKPLTSRTSNSEKYIFEIDVFLIKGFFR